MHKIIPGIVLVCGILFAPVASHAQGDQKIVMRCTFDGYTNQTLDYVIDLAAKTISLTHTTQAGGSSVVETYTPTLTQVTDDKIAWAYSYNNNTFTANETLDRYTGRIVDQITFPGGQTTALMSCQRQQKQF